MRFILDLITVFLRIIPLIQVWTALLIHTFHNFLSCKLVFCAVEELWGCKHFQNSALIQRCLGKKDVD